MAIDVRLDPFLKARQADPDQMVRSVPVEKAWSDEARAAALEARRRGYVGSDEPVEEPGYGRRVGLVKPDTGHKVNIDSEGEWRHEGVESDRPSGGRGAKALARRLARTHGVRKPVAKVYPLGPGPGAPIPSSVPTQTARQGMKDTLRAKSAQTFSPVGKAAPKSQRPPGPRVIEVDGDQDSIARDYDLLTPGQTTDKKEEGGCLFSPVRKVWSDEAREAAAEARRTGAGRTIRPSAAEARRQQGGRTPIRPSLAEAQRQRREGKDRPLRPGETRTFSPTGGRSPREIAPDSASDFPEARERGGRLYAPGKPKKPQRSRDIREPGSTAIPKDVADAWANAARAAAPKSEGPRVAGR